MAFRVRCRHSAHARNRSRIQRHKEIRPALRATFPKLSHETDSIEAVPPRHVSIESFFFFRSAGCAAFRWKRSPEPGALEVSSRPRSIGPHSPEAGPAWFPRGPCTHQRILPIACCGKPTLSSSSRQQGRHGTVAFVVDCGWADGELASRAQETFHECMTCSPSSRGGFPRMTLSMMLEGPSSQSTWKTKRDA